MKAHRIQLKLFFGEPDRIAANLFVPVFHEWVKHRKIDGELLIDVADYRHVSGGPAVLLVGHGSDYAIDYDGGRAGLLYTRKPRASAREVPIADAFRSALEACRMLENEPSLSPLRFSAGEVLFRVPDRLAAPSTDETFSALKPELDEVLSRAFAGLSVRCSREGDAREMLTVRIAVPDAPDVATILSRLRS